MQPFFVLHPNNVWVYFFWSFKVFFVVENSFTPANLLNLFSEYLVLFGLVSIIGQRQFADKSGGERALVRVDRRDLLDEVLFVGGKQFFSLKVHVCIILYDFFF